MTLSKMFNFVSEGLFAKLPESYEVFDPLIDDEKI